MARAIIIAILTFAAFAHSQPKPEWVDRLPLAGRGANYRYRVASGEGLTLEAARTEAFNDGVNQSMNAIGLFKEVVRDPVTGKVAVSQDTVTSELPIEVVCEYSKNLIVKRGVKVYLLLRVAEDVFVKLRYVPFDCKENKEIERK